MNPNEQNEEILNFDIIFNGEASLNNEDDEDDADFFFTADFDLG